MNYIYVGQMCYKRMFVSSAFRLRTQNAYGSGALSEPPLARFVPPYSRAPCKMTSGPHLRGAAPLLENAGFGDALGTAVKVTVAKAALDGVVPAMAEKATHLCPSR